MFSEVEGRDPNPLKRSLMFRRHARARAVAISVLAALVTTTVTFGAETQWQTDQEVRIPVTTEHPYGTNGSEVLEKTAAEGQSLELAGKLLLPPTPGKYATVVAMIPYGLIGGARTAHRLTAARFFRDEGYAVLVVDVRGTGASDGVFCLFCTQEQRDLYAVMDWVVAQPWSNGRIGMYGHSYPGISGLLAAAQDHPALKAVIAVYAYSDLYREGTWHNGMLNQLLINAWTAYFASLSSAGSLGSDDSADPKGFAERMLDRPRAKPPLQGALEHPYDTKDGYYEERSIHTKFDKITVPTLLIDGWSDGFSRGAIWNFRGIASEHKKLAMFPWGHQQGTIDVNNPYSGAAGVDPSDPDASESKYQQMRARKIQLENDWFARYLKGDLTVDTGSPVEYYDAVTAKMTTASTFPPAGTALRSLYLSGDKSGTASSLNDGSLSASVPTRSGTGPDRYHYVPSYGTTETFTKWGEVAALPTVRVDQRADESQALTYTTAPMTQEIELAGPMELRFFASTTAQDMDWVVKVSDVAPLEDCSGTNYAGEDRDTPNDCSTLITTGYLKASHHEVNEDLSRPAEPWIENERSLPVKDRLIEYRVDVWPTAWTIQKGHRLRVTIASSDAPNHLPSQHPGVNTIYHDSDHPSRLLVTVKAVPPSALAARVEEPDRGARNSQRKRARI